MSNKLYVGGLSYDTTEDALRGLFAEVGGVSEVKIIIDKITGRNKGFAFVEMSSDSYAHAAIQNLNGRSLDGRKLSVSEARPPAPRDDRSARGRW